MTIKAVFFDAAGTLIKTSRPVAESYMAVAENYGMKVSGAEVSERFRSCFEASPPLAFPGAREPVEQLEREWWKQLVRCVFEPWGRFEHFDRFFDELFAYFARPEAWTLYADVLKTLPLLKKRGLILCVISNFDSRLIGIMEGLEAAHWFEEIILSSRVGHAKPARQIFDKALARHNLAPEEAMHVGDSEESDLCGAVNAGITGILIDRTSKIPPPSFPRIDNLNQILTILDGAGK